MPVSNVRTRARCHSECPEQDTRAHYKIPEPIIVDVNVQVNTAADSHTKTSLQSPARRFVYLRCQYLQVPLRLLPTRSNRVQRTKNIRIRTHRHRKNEGNGPC